MQVINRPDNWGEEVTVGDTQSNGMKSRTEMRRENQIKSNPIQFNDEKVKSAA
jgi:hypothetical protein